MKTEKSIKATKFIHQGDILFIKIDSEEKGMPIKPSLDHGIVIHHGEALGHYHAIKNTDSDKVIVLLMHEKNSIKTMFIKVKEPVTVYHEEHLPITLDAGNWIARTQRETMRGIVRAVTD